LVYSGHPDISDAVAAAMRKPDAAMASWGRFWHRSVAQATIFCQSGLRIAVTDAQSQNGRWSNQPAVRKAQ
jgi:hypothetical protein